MNRRCGRTIAILGLVLVCVGHSLRAADDRKQPGGSDKAARENTPPLAVAPFDTAEAQEHQQRWAKHLGVDVEITNSIGMKLVLIPPGEFLMGLTAAQQSKKDKDLPWPQQHVRISRPFYFGVHEVTQEQYQKVMGKNPSFFNTSTKAGMKYLKKERDTRRWPVEEVSWENAREFCKRLGKKNGHKYRLPTEAEWEYCCRAGTVTPFHFGTALNGRQTNCDGRWPHGTKKPGPCLGRPTDVGSYPANPFGLYDVHGNVSEWVLDRSIRKRREGLLVDPIGPTAGPDRDSRGGAWDFEARGCGSAWGTFYPKWVWETTEFSNANLGFRVLRECEKTAEKAPGDGEQPASSDKAGKESTPPPAVAPFDAARAREHQQRWAKHLGVPVEITNSIGMKLVLIPPGEFLMGLAEAYQNKKNPPRPQQHVRISRPFYCGVHEVTQEQYQKVMGKNPSFFNTSTEAGMKWLKKKTDTRRWPVEEVGWEEAREFCKRLGKQEGHKYRLPTEAEWEYCCRAGTITPFHFGTALNGRQTNCDGRWPHGTKEPGPCLSQPTNVGSYPANPFGLCDVHGNVSEWVLDIRRKKSEELVVDPMGPTAGPDRASRGGTWDTSARGCGSAWGAFHPRWVGETTEFSNFNLGFRVLRECEKATEKAPGDGATNSGDTNR